MDAQPGEPGFNYEFLIFLIISALLAIFFLLYFNRLFASVVSYAIRTYTWHTHRVYIDVKAVQISLLGGRVFFTGLRYHGPNETFLIQHGDVTWRYWLRRVRKAEAFATETSDAAASSDGPKNSTLPCRVHVKLAGLEWFVYNRSPAYDSVLAGLADFDLDEANVRDPFPNNEQGTSSSEKNNAPDKRPTDVARQDAAIRAYGTGPRLANADCSSTASDSGDDSHGIEHGANSLPPFLRLLPIHVECQKPAVVVGNDNTKAILIVKATSASTIVDASQTKTCDPYRQLIKVDFDHPVIEMRENDECKEDQIIRAVKQREEVANLDPSGHRSFFRLRRRKVLNTLRNLIPYWRRSVQSFSTESRDAIGTVVPQIPGSNQWRGLSRYLDDRYQDDKARWSSVEYAAATTILDSPGATFSMYWDVAGKVPETARRHSNASFDTTINGSEAPAWGMTLSIKGGLINYGPWADRQRADLQKVFFPTLSRDAIAAVPLSPGLWRLPTQFHVFVEVEEAITLRIPTREESKNWRWRGKEPPIGQQSAIRKRRSKTKKENKGEVQPVRAAGWLELKVSANATISYSMDLLARPTGYQNHLSIDLPGTELWSSVNHDVLWKSAALHVVCDLSNPLGWNTLRDWQFQVFCYDMKIYLLRDHIFLLTDLVDDWASGPPPEYLVFTPYIYHLDLQLHNMQLYLNVNDENIIDKATTLDDNSYLILSSPMLTAKTSIPLEKFRPDKNNIPFNIEANSFDLSLHASQSDTLAAFLTSSKLGHGESLAVTGSYEYNATTSSSNTDTLIMKIHGQSPYAYLYGFLVHYALMLKDNYFGDHVHFRTLDEYQDQLQSGIDNPHVESARHPPTKVSNDLDIILAIDAANPRILLPTNLYSADRCVQCELADLSVDLRFTNYFMDLELLLSPLGMSLGDFASSSDAEDTDSDVQLFIDGVRVFGHRTFGLPPSEPTYLCNWDVSVGAVDGECTVDFCSLLAKGGAAFGFMFDDVENALVPYSTLIFHDVTFVRVDLAAIHVWLHVDDAAFRLSAGPIEVRSNDWAGSHYSKRASIIIPDVELSCINAVSAARLATRRQHPVDAIAYLRTNIQLSVIGRNFQFQKDVQVQQHLLRREDQRTGRTPFLLHQTVDHDFVPNVFDAPAQCAPYPAYPVVESQPPPGQSHPRPLRRQSSFWSISSSGGGSFHAAQSQPRSRARSRQTLALSAGSSGTEGDRRDSQHTKQGFLVSGLRATRHSRDKPDHPEHSSVAFTSQYCAPPFPLENVEPEKPDTTFNDGPDEDKAKCRPANVSLTAINPRELSEDHSQASTMIEFPLGITAFLYPEALRYANSLLLALQPHEPEDVLDSLQIDSVGQIFSKKKQSHISGIMDELLIKLPKADVRIMNSALTGRGASRHEKHDQYDIRFLNSLLILRNVKDQTSANSATRTSLCFRLQSAEVSASERLSAVQMPQAAVVINIEGVELSVGTKDITYFDADISSIVGSTASGEIEFLASLIHRTGSIASELGDLFSETASRQNSRMSYLACRLLEEGKDINDPPFLIRPSAVLRSAHEHMRTKDSWKMIMRLRQIWVTLSQEARVDIVTRCQDASVVSPPNATENVIAAFQTWRSWDLNDPSSSVLLGKMVGDKAGQKKGMAEQYPLLGACKLAELRFVLDPGPKQNNFALLDSTVRVDRRFTDQADIWPGTTDLEGFLTTINLCCGETAIHLNWELCELAEDVLRLYNTARSPAASLSSKISTDQLSCRENYLPTAMHVIFEMPKGSLEMETINLTARSRVDMLKASILFCSTDKDLAMANMILHCNDVRSELDSRRQSLGTFSLETPCVFLSQELQRIGDNTTHIVKTSASSENMILRLKQDPVGLLEVLDRVVVDEVARLLRLKDFMPSSAHSPERTEDSKERMSTFVVNAALFLNHYALSLPLLQTLTYRISGSVARASCNADFARDIVFDFDVKENFHEMQIDVQNRPRSISLLQIPPANGRVTSQFRPGDVRVTVIASMEIIKLDASAMYSLLAALNRPQVTGAVEQMQEQMKGIQQHIAEAFRALRTITPTSNAPATVSKPNANFVYDTNLALAGVQILARTSLQSTEEPVAEILITFDKITLQASNRHESKLSPVNYPDLRLDLRQIKLDIRRGTPDALRSCGNLAIGIKITASSQPDKDGAEDWSLQFRNDDLLVNLSPKTVSTVIDVGGYLGSKIRDLDTSQELGYLRKFRQNKPKIRINDDPKDWGEDNDLLESMLSSITYRFEIRNIRLCWDVADNGVSDDSNNEDLVLLINLIEFGTRTRKSARLTIKDFLLQTVPTGQDKAIRSMHSARLPEVMFNVAYISTLEARRMAFQAVGDSLDLRLTSAFIIPAAKLINSISLSMRNIRAATDKWAAGKPGSLDSPTSKTPDSPPSSSQRRSTFGNKRLESLLVDADFAGAVVYVSTKKSAASTVGEVRSSQVSSSAGKYGQFNPDVSGSGAVLRSPGLAWKAHYQDNGQEDPSLHGEVKINASSNTLYPSVVPLVLDILSSIKEAVSDDLGGDSPANRMEQPKPKAKSGDEDNFLTADPSAVFGRMRLNLGLRICRQEFSLSCQPIARVSATACFESIYFTLNTVASQEQGNFFAMSGVISNPQASVQHVYSRDSTASCELESVTISLMNSKHFSGVSGVSAILKVSPMKVSVNAKQVQDFLLFREIWYPKEIRQKAPVQAPKTSVDTAQTHLVQRYQQVAATAAFPWTATVSIEAIDVGLDLGQAIGKSVFQINELWISSKKTSDWEQNLCLGFKKIGIDSTGRLSGFVALQDFRVRSSIHWPRREEALNETPLVQASLAFNALRMKAAFDYQAFLVADITALEFLMYNVRQGRDGNGDRLVAIFDGEAVQVFGTATSVAQSVALYQAFQKLIQERRDNFETSLREIEKFMKRKSISSRGALQRSSSTPRPAVDDTLSKSPISLDTDVVVTFRTLNLGVFPSTFSDHQVFKVEALNAYARFAASIEQRRIHSILRMTLGQLRIGLAGVRDAEAPKTMSEMTVDDVVKRSTGSRGGTILKVPRVEAAMETWQEPASTKIEYVFKSAFEGKVEVGWNYSRISYIRGMWANHAKSLEQTWGRQIPMTAVKITEIPDAEGEQQKITAEVNVPQSRYEYLALEPPVIETPQLRDMGEATPPLEWIGLHRERLPNLTHQIVIVSLLELAGEVEDAYSRILGAT